MADSLTSTKSFLCITTEDKRETKSLLKAFYNKDLEFTLANNNILEQYNKFKNKNGMNTYLENIKDSGFRRCLTKLRLSNHILEVEKGRHSKPSAPRMERFCKLCNMNAVEDEIIHFLLNCPGYTGTRDRFVKAISMMNPHFKGLEYNNKFLFLTKSESCIIQNLMAEYICDIFQLISTMGNRAAFIMIFTS